MLKYGDHKRGTITTTFCIPITTRLNDHTQWRETTIPNEKPYKAKRTRRRRQEEENKKRTRRRGQMNHKEEEDNNTELNYLNYPQYNTLSLIRSQNVILANPNCWHTSWWRHQSQEYAASACLRNQFRSNANFHIPANKSDIASSDASSEPSSLVLILLRLQTLSCRF